jgi:hypothetical protein
MKKIIGIIIGFSLFFAIIYFIFFVLIWLVCWSFSIPFSFKIVLGIEIIVLSFLYLYQITQEIRYKIKNKRK